MQPNELATDSVGAHLEGLLGAVRGALLAGDLGAIGPLTDGIGQALDGLSAVPPDDRTLTRLRQLALQNSDMIDAAGRGVRAARQRLAEVEDARRGLGTYDHRGRRNLIGDPAPGELTQRS